MTVEKTTPKEIIEKALSISPTEQGVDDIVAQIIIDRLRAEGYEITQVADGQSAKE